MSPQELGNETEKNVARKLSNLGYAVRLMPYGSAFDLLVGDKRVEVKAARPSDAGRWGINIHRHGSVDESRVDAYIIVLQDVPGNSKMPVYLVFPSPIRCPRLDFSFSSLVRKYRDHIDNWSVLESPASANNA